MVLMDRFLGRPCGDYIVLYNLEKNNRPMDWFTSIILMTQKDNKYDAVDADINGNKLTKFSTLNWTTYSNTNEIIMNASTVSHIFERSCKMFDL